MLLGSRRKLNQQTGEMEGGGNTLSFNGGLPDVQINDPRLPLAEALAKLPGAISKGASNFQASQLAEAEKAKAAAAAPADDPYGLGTGNLDVGAPKVSGGSPVGGGGKEVPLSLLEMMKRMGKYSPGFGG